MFGIRAQLWRRASGAEVPARQVHGGVPPGDCAVQGCHRYSVRLRLKRLELCVCIPLYAAIMSRLRSFTLKNCLYSDSDVRGLPSFEGRRRNRCSKT